MHGCHLGTIYLSGLKGIARAPASDHVCETTSIISDKLTEVETPTSMKDRFDRSTGAYDLSLNRKELEGWSSTGLVPFQMDVARGDPWGPEVTFGLHTGGPQAQTTKLPHHIPTTS